MYTLSGSGEKYREITEGDDLEAKEQSDRWFISFGTCVLECSKEEYQAYYQEKEHTRYTMQDKQKKTVHPLSYEQDTYEGAADYGAVPVDAQERCQIIIATSTIALQEQLARDVRTVMQMLGMEIPVTVAKGMKNFACMKRVSAYFRKHPKDVLAKQIWKRCFDSHQDRAEIGANISDTLWAKLTITNFGGRHCQNCNCTGNCVYRRMRMQIARGNGIVICHRQRDRLNS